MNTIVSIIGLACLGFILSHVVAPMFKIKIKPFTCESCMSWWLALIWFYPLGIDAILFAAIAYVIAGLIWKL